MEGSLLLDNLRDVDRSGTLRGSRDRAQHRSREYGGPPGEEQDPRGDRGPGGTLQRSRDPARFLQQGTDPRELCPNSRTLAFMKEKRESIV